MAYVISPPRNTAEAPGTEATVALANPAVSDSQKDKVSPRSVSSDTRRATMVLMNYLAILLLAVDKVLDAGNYGHHCGQEHH